MARTGQGSRSAIFQQLSPGARREPGISPVNLAVIALISLASVIAIIETEPVIRDHVDLAKIFRTADFAFAVIFTIEYLLRVWVAGEDERYRGWTGRLRYVITPAALLDLVAVLPFLLTFAISDMFLLRLFRLLRILTLARLGRFSDGARLLMKGLQIRKYEIGLCVCFSAVALIISASLLHLAEGSSQPEAFGSIPRALWWSVATLTTVGYGDVYPITALGRVFGGVTAIAGIAFIALPAGILAAAFSEVFQRQTRDKRETGSTINDRNLNDRNQGGTTNRDVAKTEG
jgi:voltage-gated potassium channel